LKNKADICLNCDHKLLSQAKFCPTCGVKATFNELSLKTLFKSFFDTFLNIEYKVLRSFRDVWIPNRITHSYISGVRSNYVHPFRFFFICLVIFFSLTAIAINRLDNDSEISQAEKVGEIQMYEKYESEKVNYSSLCDASVLDSLQKDIFPASFKKGSKKLDGNFGTLNFKESGLTQADLYLKTEKELVEQYKIAKIEKYPNFKMGWFHTMLVKQGLKIQKHLVDYLKFSVKNLLWGVILLTVLIAGVLKLVYVRHDSFYAEHVIQVINYHCVIALIASLFLIIYLIFDINFAILPGFICTFLPIFLYFSLKKYYHEHFFKTFIKVSIINIFYFIFALGIVFLNFFFSLFFF